MTKEEYEKKIDELQAQLDELKNTQIEETKSALPTPPHPRPYLEDDQIMFYVNSMGELDETTWISDRFDLGAREIGNVFQTKEDTEFAAERLKVIAEMREWAGKWNDKIVLNYIGNEDIVSISHLLLFRNTFGEMRFATTEDAENCIKAVGKERLKKYYFMIT